MKYLLLLLTTIFVFAKDFSLNITQSVKNEDLVWNFAGNNGSPNILSEIKYKDIKSDYTKIELTNKLRKNFQVNIAYGYSKQRAGNFQDSDYSQDNRKGEYSRSIGDSSDGYGKDISISFGKNYIKKRYQLTPYLGYKEIRHNYTMTNGQMVIGTEDLDGLNSSYTDKYKGFIFGIRVQHPISKTIKWAIDAHKYYFDYYAKANWNLRTDLQHPISHEHFGDGDGYSVSLTFLYKYSKKLTFYLRHCYQKYNLSDGLHTKYYSNGNIKSVKLNEVSYKAQLTGLGIKYLFLL